MRPQSVYLEDVHAPIATPKSRSMTDLDQLRRLASLIEQRNEIEEEIASIIDRPAHSGHIGKFVASIIFDIQLSVSASHKNGSFASGRLAGKSVNISKYSKDDGILNVKPNPVSDSDSGPDFYVVMTGPRTAPQSSRGKVHPWVIETAYLFEGRELLRRLLDIGVSIGVATSVRRHIWDAAEIYPRATNPALPLTSCQRDMLALFGAQW